MKLSKAKQAWNMLTTSTTIFLALSACSVEPAMKEVAYPGGIVAFVIPKNWVEEYGPDGGGTFYESTRTSGVLRLTLISARSQRQLSKDSAFHELAGLKSIRPDSVQRLTNGNALAADIQASTEQGQPVTIYWWHVANAVPPQQLNIALFSYTVPTSQENSPAVKRYVQALTESIKNSRIHLTLDESSAKPREKIGDHMRFAPSP